MANDIAHHDLRQLDAARLRAALARTRLRTFQPPQSASAAEDEMHRQFLISQRAEQNAKLAEIGRQQAQKEAERSTTSASVEKLQATIPVLQERVDIRKTLVDKALASKVVYLRSWSAFSRTSCCSRAGCAKPTRPSPC